MSAREAARTAGTAGFRDGSANGSSVRGGGDDGQLVHEIMSPLAAIVGYAELLRTRDDDAILAEASDAIVEAAGRLEAAVHDLLSRGASSPVPTVASGDGAPSTPPGSERKPRRRVVVVDDEPLVRSLLRITLPSDALDVLEASDGDAGIRLIAGSRPSLVVLDWQLPGRPGAEVLAEVKRRFPCLPVLVLTAAQDPAERRQAVELGADEFLTKPFSPLELLRTTERLLAERAQES